MLTRVLSNLILTVLNPSCKFSSGGLIRDPKQVRQWSRISWSPYFRTTSTRRRERSFLALRELFTFGAIISVCLTVRHFVIHTLLIYGKGANPGNVLLPSNYARHAHQMIHNYVLLLPKASSPNGSPVVVKGSACRWVLLAKGSKALEVPQVD